MKGIREIKSRIKAVMNTSQITRAMQLVAASKMKRAQAKAKAGTAYSLLLAECMQSLVEQTLELEGHPFLEKREVKHRGVLVVSTERGLCGPLNSNLFRLISEMDEHTRFVSIGRKATQFLSRTNRELLADFSISDHCRFSEVRLVVEFLKQAYLEGKIDTLEVIFPGFVNTLIQKPTKTLILPLLDLETELAKLRKRLTDTKAEYTPVKDQREMIFEPNVALMLQELPLLFIKQHIYQIILETKASEHSARMVSMKSATDNAGDLVSDLKLEYNKIRQSAITQEILEIAASTVSATA